MFKIKFFLSLFAITLVSYAYILKGDFIGDDVDRIVLNSELASYWTAMTGGLADRPLLMIIVTFISKVFGKETLYFRIASIFINSLVAYQIYKFVLELNESIQSETKQNIAILCAFAFAVHPLNSQSLTTAIQMSVPISGLLALISLRYFYKGISGLSDRNFIFSFLCLVLGMLFKPTLIFLPLVFLIFNKKINTSLFKKIFIFISYASVLIIPAAFYIFGKINKQTQSLPSINYFLVQTEVIFTYFRLMIAPYNLQFLYDFDVPKNIWDLSNWKYFAIHTGILIVGYLKLPSKLLWTLLASFYISFIPESSFFSINHLAFEHRTYLPLIFFMLFVGSGLIQFQLNASFKRLISIITVSIVLIFLILNQNRNVEIKTFGTWAYRNLLNSKDYEYHNYTFTHWLARANNIELIEPIVREYPTRIPNKGYEVLVDILDYYKYRYRQRAYHDKFLTLLEDPKLSFPARVVLNKIIIQDFANNNSNLKDLIRLERVMAKQLPIVIENQSRIITGLLKNNYLNLAKILIGPAKDQFQQADPISFLRVQVYLVVFFDEKIENLDRDIEIELQKQPDKAILKDLRDLLNLKLSHK